MVPLVAALGADVTVTGRGRLPERPLLPLLKALDQNGSKSFESKSKYLPLNQLHRIRPRAFEIPGGGSSQYTTGMLMALPALEPAEADSSRIKLDSPLVSREYVDMTLEVLSLYGITVYEEQDGFTVPAGQKYQKPEKLKLERDWSCAAFWIAMDFLGSEVEVADLPLGSHQPDRHVSELLGRDQIDITGCPDLFPTLAVVASARGETEFIGTERLRLKESDRVQSTRELVQKFGAEFREDGDSVTIIGHPKSGKLHYSGEPVETFNDHRIAMAAAVAATISDSKVTIREAARVVRKSYPVYFQQLMKMEIL